MPTTVTPQYLLEGAVYALEQCGFLLRDAAHLYQNHSYASSVALAAFAREELGRWKILLAMRKEALSGTKSTLEDIEKRCGDHLRKQSEGMLSTTMRTDRVTGLGKLLETRIKAKPGSEERIAADEQVDKLDRLKEKRVPGERHHERMAALYVDPISLSEWNRPVEKISQQSAHDFLQDARNDYVIQCDRYSNFEVRRVDDPELYAALEKWLDRPELPTAASEIDFPKI